MEREISKLKANPQNPRGAVEHDAAFNELVASIKVQGVLQPVLITPNDLIVAGHRRVEAAEKAGLKVVPVLVKEMSRIEQLQAMLAENLLRADLNVLQEGAAYNLLVEYGLKPSEIAKAVGVNSARVSDCIAILSLPETVQRQFAWGMIPVRCASVLAALPKDEQETWAQKVIDRKWNDRDLREAIHPPKRELAAFTPARAQVTTGKFQPKSQDRTSMHWIIDKLEQIEQALGRSPEHVEAKKLIRQAARLLMEKPLDSAERAATFEETKTLASVASFAMRGPQKTTKTA